MKMAHPLIEKYKAQIDNLEERLAIQQTEFAEERKELKFIIEQLSFRIKTLEKNNEKTYRL